MQSIRILMGIVAVWLFVASASAQRVTVVDGQYRILTDETDWSQGKVVTEGFGEHFGEDGPGLQAAAEVAVANEPRDGFRWSQKPVDLWNWKNTNACAIASDNLIDDVRGGGVLPEGWTIKQLGTFGKTTTTLNTVFLNWEYKDKLNPPSYAHTLSVISTPDGRHYTLDNWKGGVTMKQIYSLDSEGIFYSDDPNATDINEASYRLQVNSRGYVPEDENLKNKKKPRNDEFPPTSEPKKVEVLTSADPNDKYGLAGAGEEHYITPDLRLDYVIRFENMPDASAPAQEVLVRDTLDTRYLDLETFQLGSIRFGNTHVEVPPGRSSFFTTLPVIDGEFDLLIDANLVHATGIVTWRFTTLDPNTGELPFDPLDGFLPPNQVSPEGEGSVSFSVRALEGLPSGTKVENDARIVFDLNEPIDTPIWSNVFDTVSPTSSIVELDEAQVVNEGDGFNVRWTGSDEGSGISRFSIYVAVNDGPFHPWLENVVAGIDTFYGEADSTYRFFSIAQDATGNIEPMKSAADASTVVVVSVEDAAGDALLAFDMSQNYPNPARGSTTFTYTLPQPEHVAVDVYDLLGKRIANLVDADRAAGRHEVEMDVSRFASGVYVYRMTAGEFTRSRQLIVVR